MSKFTPHTDKDIKIMLDAIGIDSVDALFEEQKHLLCKENHLVGEGKSQQAVEKEFINFSDKNKTYRSIFRGAGSYNHYIPPIVDSLSSRSEFVTAYTPYQAEISQGILQAIFEYQSMIATLTGMEVSNASHYDVSTAFSEALIALKKRNKNTVLLSDTINPMTIEVIKTYLKPLNINLELIESENGKTSITDLEKKLNDDVFALGLSQPNYFGCIEDADLIGKTVKEKNIGYVIAANPISLALLKTPFECGADFAVGEGQPLGLPLSFGGPYLGFIATTKKNTRSLNGRIVGKTLDQNNKECFVLTMQAREQHIRREKALSSICSNQAHCALRATIYMATMGKRGLIDVAETCVSNAHYLAEEISKIKGFKLKYNAEFFHEFVITSEVKALDIEKHLAKKGILSPLPLNDFDLLCCVTEQNTKEEIDMLISALKEMVQ